MTDKVLIRQLATGVPGLDEILGGGIPEFSFNLIAGSPGTGKTTLAHQMMFALATPERPALFFTVLGEPPLKMLRYQQQFSYFDMRKVNGAVRFINLGQEMLNGNLNDLLARIVSEVEGTSPGFVFIDSIRTVVDGFPAPQPGDLSVKQFVQQLAQLLTSWQATTFMIGEYPGVEFNADPVFTVADGILWLHQSVDRNSMVRKVEVVKGRGQAPVPGLHTFRITSDGVHMFPRMVVEAEQKLSPAEWNDVSARPRLSIGVKGMDEMLGGGIPAGASVLVAGPSGSGKTTLATAFILEGGRQGEPGVIAMFEKRPSEYVASGPARRALERMDAAKQLAIVYTRPLDLSIDETLHELTRAIKRVKARRIVIDSLSGFELALAPTFREDFRETLYRMVTTLTSMGVTVMMTAELEDTYNDLRFSPHRTAFLTDGIIIQRYIELNGELKRVTAVVKMRGSAHSKDVRIFEIVEDGIVVGEKLGLYKGLLTGSPELAAGGTDSRPVAPPLVARR